VMFESLVSMMQLLQILYGRWVELSIIVGSGTARRLVAIGSRCTLW